jgi:hypothetical protein
MTELYKIVPIRECLYHGLKNCADTLGLTVDEYVELLLENTHSHKRKSCNCRKKKKYSVSRDISDK